MAAGRCEFDSHPGHQLLGISRVSNSSAERTETTGLVTDPVLEPVGSLTTAGSDEGCRVK